MAAIGGLAGCDRRRSAGQLGSTLGCAVRPRLGPDLVGNCAYLLDHLLRLKPADWLAVKITDLVGDAAAKHGPGPFDQLASHRHAGLGVAVTVFGHQLVVEPGQLRILVFRDMPQRIELRFDYGRPDVGPGSLVSRSICRRAAFAACKAVRLDCHARFRRNLDSMKDAVCLAQRHRRPSHAAHRSRDDILAEARYAAEKRDLTASVLESRA
jgi:hypothetical protein